jgi:hypothetical protein
MPNRSFKSDTETCPAEFMAIFMRAEPTFQNTRPERSCDGRAGLIRIAARQGASS